MTEPTLWPSPQQSDEIAQELAQQADHLQWTDKAALPTAVARQGEPLVWPAEFSMCPRCGFHAALGDEYRVVFTVLTGRRDDSVGWLRGGEALSAVLLTATAHGLAAEPLSEVIALASIRDSVRRILGRVGVPTLRSASVIGNHRWIKPPYHGVPLLRSSIMPAKDACAPTTDTAFLFVVRAALRAPSLHNSQPWRFRRGPAGVEIRADRTRRMPVADPRDWGLRLSCGAAAFNAKLALALLGQATEMRLRPDPSDRDLMVRLEYTERRPPTSLEKRLYAVIPRRHSNRAPFWPIPVGAEARSRLVGAARAEGAWLDLVIGTTAVTAVSLVARTAAQVLDQDPAYRAELASWTRPDGGSRDGVPAWAGGPSPQPTDLLPRRPFNTQQRASGTQQQASGRNDESEPLVAILGTPGDTPNDQLLAGIALQRVLLTLTDAGLSASMLSQPIEVQTAREALRLALRRQGTPQMVLGIGYGQPGFATPRREPTEVIDP